MANIKGHGGTRTQNFQKPIFAISNHHQQRGEIRFLTTTKRRIPLTKNSVIIGSLSRGPSFPLGITTTPWWTRLQHQQYSFNNRVILSTQIGSISHFSSWGSGPPRSPGGGNRWAGGLGLLGGASILFGKTKYLLAALKFTKLASLGSMVFTIGTYSMFFGFPYAVGVVALIAIHEAGHALVLHQKGIPFSPAVFIPFMGAVIATKQMPRDAWEDAVVGYGGPALGSLGAGVCAVAAHATDSQLLFALSDFGFMVNLFNLLPIGSLDGGRITGAISPWIGVGGIGLGTYLAFIGAVSNPIFYLVLMTGGYETFMRLYDPINHIPPGYYNVSMNQRATMTVGYFGLIAALITAMHINNQSRKPPEVLVREAELEKRWEMM